jgi:hypothetical protein
MLLKKTLIPPTSPSPFFCPQLGGGVDLAKYVSEPVAVTFPTGPIGDVSSSQEVAHGYYYAPLNGDFCAPEGEACRLEIAGASLPTLRQSQKKKKNTHTHTHTHYTRLKGQQAGFSRAYV